MRQFKLLLLAALAASAFLSAARGAPVDAFNVAWDSPSANHHGSMPLGNGDIALNAWMTKDGDLHFYIGKTDAWDDNARLLKVGKVRVHFEPNPIVAGQAVPPGAEARRRLHRDHDRRRQCLEAIRNRQSAIHNPPLGGRQSSGHPRHRRQRHADGSHAFVELWRTNQHELAEAAGQRRADEPASRRASRRRRSSSPTPSSPASRPRRLVSPQHQIGRPGVLAEVQGLTGFQQADPLLHRTFGAVVTAAQRRAAGRSPPALAARHVASLQRLRAHAASRRRPSTGWRTWTRPSAASRRRTFAHAGARPTSVGGASSGTAVGFAPRPTPTPSRPPRPSCPRTRIRCASAWTRAAATSSPANWAA